MIKQRKPRKFWTIFDTQMKTIFHQFDSKHKADLALRNLLEKGFKKGVFEIIPTQEVLPRRKRR